MPFQVLMNCRFLLAIDWKNSAVLCKDNIASVLTINGGYVSGMLKVMFMMLKWLITIKGAVMTRLSHKKRGKHVV
jgi:hypothetical protein